MSNEQRNKPYKSVAWKRIRETVLKYDHGICQRCAGNYMPRENAVKRHTKAVLVHHHFKVTEYPKYKYMMYVTMPDGTKQRNLWSLCSACHEEIHSDTHRSKIVRDRALMENANFTTPERWD